MKSILLHGLGQSAASWDDMVRYMEQTSDILCPELPQWLEDHEPHYNSLYSGLEKYCAQLEGPLNLCGLSLGGILALQYGIEYPERVNSLVLIGTQYVMPKGILKFQNILFHLMPKGAFQETGFRKDDFIALCRSMLDLNFQADLKKISCPVLVVCGEQDRANKAASMQLKEQIPSAELYIVSGAGHEVNVEAPAELGREIGRFLKTTFDNV